MTTELLDYRSFKVSRGNKANSVSNEQVQLDWIKGLLEQVEFANRRDILPKYFLQLKVTLRKFEV